MILSIIADSKEECVRRLLIWNEAMENKGLRVKCRNKKVVICSTGLDLLQSSGEDPCAGIGNSIYLISHIAQGKCSIYLISLYC